MNSKKKNSHYGTVKDPSDLAMMMDDLIQDPPSDLSERQRRIINFRLRGFTQKAIAKVEDVSQPMIAKEIAKIREIYKLQGRTVDQELVVGEAVSIYQEVERRSWEIYFLHKKSTPTAAMKALDTVMASREKTHKLLMDLGIMRKAASSVEHTFKVAPFIEQFEQMPIEEKERRLSNIIDSSLSDLKEPEPPQLLADIELANLEEPEPPEGNDDGST